MDTNRQKINYEKEMEEILSNVNKGSTLLLHSCYAPCSSHVLSLLTDYFSITVFYYNPNIEPYEEYQKRKEEEIRLIKELPHTYPIEIIDCDYDNDLYHEKVKGLEQEKERGKRCTVCFQLRLEKTAQIAKENHFDFFATTLTVSPYKNAELINLIGKKLERKYNINYLPSDFKKKDGYKHSILLSNKYNLYRQNYCGCIYSKRP